MAFPKGGKNPNAGRPKGSISDKTKIGHTAIRLFVDSHADRLSGWLDAIAATNPIEAFKAYMSVVEYAIPKLQRQEITGKDGERLQINVVTGVPPVTIEGKFQEVKKLE